MRRKKRTARGGVQVEKQQRFTLLIAQGVTISEAARVVGINRTTGTRWCHGRTILNSAGEPVQYPPVKIIPVKPRSVPSLSEAERILIPDLRPAGHSIRAISRETAGRHRTSAVRSAETSTRTAAITRTMLNSSPAAASAVTVSVASTLTRRCGRSFQSCWISAGARSKSLTS